MVVLKHTRTRIQQGLQVALIDAKKYAPNLKRITHALGSPPITYTPFAARTQVRGEAEPVRAANFQPDKNR